LTRFCNALIFGRSIFPLTFLRRGKTELRWSNLQKESYTTREHGGSRRGNDPAVYPWTRRSWQQSTAFGIWV